jgi:hypothetical protein
MKSLSILITTIIFVCAISMTAIAGQIWQGKGKIVRGAGEGGSPSLKIEVEGNTITFLSGPQRNQKVTIPNLNGSVEIAQNTWRFQKQNGKLTITLYQKNPYRVILYRLSIR